MIEYINFSTNGIEEKGRLSPHIEKDFGPNMKSLLDLAIRSQSFQMLT